MSLRKDIADRAYSAFARAGKAHDMTTEQFAHVAPSVDMDAPFNGGILAQNAAWLAVADECIRQMEWVAHQTRVEAIADCAAQDQGLISRMFETVLPLTLAPEGWKP